MAPDVLGRPVNVSLAAFPGMRHEVAAQVALSGIRAGVLAEPLFGPLAAEHVQLVPQCIGQLTMDVAARLRAAYPGSRLRIHANARVLDHHRLADLANMDEHAEWFRQAARVSRALDAPAYTAHSGRRSDATMARMLDNARRAAHLFGCPVGVEGQYPTTDERWLVSSWREYGQLLDSGVPFALDLSHLNILARHSRRIETGLVSEMLASQACIEVHLSDNDGVHDDHRVCKSAPWWYPLLSDINPGAVVFTEGNQRRFLKEISK